MKYWHKENVCVKCEEIITGKYFHNGVCPFCGNDGGINIDIKSQIVRYKIEWYRLWKPTEKEYLVDVPSPDIDYPRPPPLRIEPIPPQVH